MITYYWRLYYLPRNGALKTAPPPPPKKTIITLFHMLLKLLSLVDPDLSSLQGWGAGAKLRSKN